MCVCVYVCKCQSWRLPMGLGCQPRLELNTRRCSPIFLHPLIKRKQQRREAKYPWELPNNSNNNVHLLGNLCCRRGDSGMLLPTDQLIIPGISSQPSQDARRSPDLTRSWSMKPLAAGHLAEAQTPALWWKIPWKVKKTWQNLCLCFQSSRASRLKSDTCRDLENKST